MNMDTVEKRMPEWYSSGVDIASHTEGKYTICLCRSGTFRASYEPSRKTMVTNHKEVDGINCHYKGHGDATHFLNACGVFTDKDLADAYSSDDWSIDMNPWFSVQIVSDGNVWPDDYEILYKIPTQEEWEGLVIRLYKHDEEE